MTQTNTFGVHFVTRPIHRDPSQLTIFIRFVFNGTRTENSLKISIPEKNWDKEKGQIISKQKDMIKISLELEMLRAKAYSIYRGMLLDDDEISVEHIRNKFFGIEQKGKTLLDAFNYHNETQKVKLSHGTLKNYYTTKKYILRYLKEKLKIKDIPLKKVNYKFITEFEYFLRKVNKPGDKITLNQNGLMKHMERLQKVLNMAYRIEWMEEKVMDKYRLEFAKVERGYLTEEELFAIENYDFSSLERLDKVRDKYVFSCYTGLSYVEISNLGYEHIHRGIDGELWISMRRQKSTESFSVPILPAALDILKKYKEHPEALMANKVFPPLSNQKTNQYLKEIASLCGIDKNISFHLARHTFGTTVTLANGVPIESVSKMMGHTKISTTQIYAKVIEKKVSEDMLQLRKKLGSGGNSKSRQKKAI